MRQKREERAADERVPQTSHRFILPAFSLDRNRRGERGLGAADELVEAVDRAAEVFAIASSARPIRLSQQARL